MTVSVAGEKITVKDTTVDVTVPDNPYAKLMYYLHCIEDCISIDFGSLSDYSNYYKYGSDEKSAVVELCQLLTPELLEECGVFFYCGSLDRGNKFIELKYEGVAAAANREITIGAYRCVVTQKMLYKYDWEMRYYKNPLRTVTSSSFALINRSETPSYTPSYSSSSSCDYMECCLCEILCCGFLDCLDCYWCDDCCDCDEICECRSAVMIFLCIVFPFIGIFFFVAGFFAANSFMKACSFYSSIIGMFVWLTLFV